MTFALLFITDAAWGRFWRLLIALTILVGLFALGACNSTPEPFPPCPECPEPIDICEQAEKREIEINKRQLDLMLFNSEFRPVGLKIVEHNNYWLETCGDPGDKE